MKRVIYITLFCFLIALKGKTQSYYSKRVDVAGKTNVGYGILNISDSLYVASYITETPIPNLSYSASLLKFDLNGVLLASKRFKPINYNYSCWGGMYYKNNKIYTSGVTDYGLQLQSGLYVFDENCDTVFTKSYGDTTFYNYGQKIIPFTKTSNKLLLIGITDSTCGTNHPGVYKPVIKVVDTNGVLLQTKIYLTNCKYRNITGADICEDKGYLLCGSELQTFLGNYFVMKLDSNLNLLWTTYYNSTSRNICNITKSINGGYLFGHTITDSIWNFTYTWERATLTKLNSNGTIKWQKNYGVKQTDIATSKVIELSNGDIVLTGNRRVSGNELKGFIIRTDSLGNLKWWKDYRPETAPIQDTTADNYLWDILELPNKDIAAVGWSGSTVFTPNQQTWLLKVDSNGCFGSSNCPPNLITGIKENISNSVGLSAYPNPFKDELNINYSILDFEGVAQLQLIELASGRLIDNIELTQSFGTKQFNTQNLANGLYVLSLKQNNKPSVNFKVINIK